MYMNRLLLSKNCFQTINISRRFFNKTKVITESVKKDNKLIKINKNPLYEYSFDEFLCDYTKICGICGGIFGFYGSCKLFFTNRHNGEMFFDPLLIILGSPLIGFGTFVGFMFGQLGGLLMPIIVPVYFMEQVSSVNKIKKN